MAKEETEYIYNIATANKELANSFQALSFQFSENIRTNRAWMMVNRLTTGSGFWKVSNKIKGINDGFVILHNRQKKAIKQNEQMGKSLQDYYSIAKKIPKTGMFDTSEEGKKTAIGIVESDEFQNQLDFNKKLKAAGGLKGKTAMQATMKFYDDNIKLQQELLDAQMHTLIKEEKYKERGFLGKLERKWDNFKDILKMLPNFLRSGLVVLKRVIFGMMWFVLLAPLLMKVLRWGYKYSQNLTPEQRQKWANARDKIIEIGEGIKELAVAIFEGRWVDSIKIWLGGIVVPLIEGLMIVLGIIGEVLVSAGRDAWNYIESGRLSDDIAAGIRNLLGDLSDPAREQLNTNLNRVDGVVQQLWPAYGLYRMSRGEHWSHDMARRHAGKVFGGSREIPYNPDSLNETYGSRTSGNVINVNVNGRVGASDMEIKDIAQKVAREINIQLNRTTSAVGRFG